MKSSNERSLPDENLLVGEIVGVHGLRGALKVRSFADSPALFVGGMTFCLERPDGHVQDCALAWAKPHGKGILVAIEGVSDRETAEGLIGSRLAVARATLPELEAGTFYWFELIGMSVYTRQGQYLGAVENIIPTGSNDVYVVRDGETEVLVPALASVVQVVDTDQGRMEVDLPEGL